LKSKAIGVAVLSTALVAGLVYFSPSLPGAGRAEAGSSSPCLTSFFETSLHFTGEGMRYWYEEEGGFMEITKIPYDQLDCKKCHVKSCDQCHAKKVREKLRFSEDKAKSINTCLPCHTREGLTFRFDGKKERLDVHMAAGMVCSDCHYRTDVHGDGRPRVSMRHPKAVRATCQECHVEQERESPLFDPDTVSHSAHGDRLDCAACHVQNTMACYNCHFDTFLKTGERKNTFIPMKEWTLLVNYDGRVTSGSAMSLVYKDRKFVAYVPYFTHSVSAEGRTCDECHGNEAVRRMVRGEKVPVVDFKDGEAVPWQGVVPVLPDKLDWAFLEKTADGWKKIGDSQGASVQFAAFGLPLTPEQLEMLAREP